MKIAIVSDSHDNRTLLEAAVLDAKARGAEAVLHCGDVVAPSTLNVLQPMGLPVHVIHGNNSGDLYMMASASSSSTTRITHRRSPPPAIGTSSVAATITARRSRG